MEKGKLALLKAEIGDQVNTIKKLFTDVEDRSKGIDKSIPKMESLGYKLHSLYCAFEDLFKIVSNYFENSIANKKAYHRELLKMMRIEIPGIRPALLSEYSFILLDELRAFRHYFRHAYNYELDIIRLKNLLKVVEGLKKIYLNNINKFLQNIL